MGLKGVMLKEKKNLISNIKHCITLFYITSSKCQKYSDGEQIRGCQG